MKNLKLFAFAILFIQTSVHAQTLRLGLDEAISLAIENNRTLKVSHLGISRAQQQTRVVRSRALPSLNVDGMYAHYFDRSVFFGLGNDNGQNNDKLPYARVGGENQLTAVASFIQPLYDPSIRPEMQSARLFEDVSQHAYRHDETEVVADVKQTYLNVLVLGERLKLQEESLNRNIKVLQDSRSLFRQGRALRVDTLRAYTTVKNLQPDIIKLTDAITNAKLRLTTLLGIESDENFVLSDSLVIKTVVNIPTEEQVFEDARKFRSDLKILGLNEEIIEKQIHAAKAKTLPSVSLVGQYQVLSQSNSFPLDNTYWPSVSYLGAQLSVPVFNGYRNSAKIKDSKLAREQIAIQVKDAQEQLQVDAHQVVADLHETTERLETQHTVRETAKLSYDIIQYRYEKGVASRLELTDAELALTIAELSYLEAVYDYLSAHIQLDRVVGRVGNF